MTKQDAGKSAKASNQPVLEYGRVETPRQFFDSKMQERGTLKRRAGTSDKRAIPESTPSGASSSKLPLGQRLRASLGAYKPKHRKIGKQRPSIGVPGPALLHYKPKYRKRGKQRPSRGTPPLVPGAVYRPRRRKHGKQRPSILLEGTSVKLLIPASELTKQQEDVGRWVNQLTEQERNAPQAISADTGEHPPLGVWRCLWTRTHGRVALPLALDGEATVSKELCRVCGDGLDPGKNFCAWCGTPFDDRSESVEMKKRVPHEASKDPTDNYEISDLEEDKRGKRIEPNRQGKHIPAWSINFREIMKDQATIDPDSIFGNQVPHYDEDQVMPDHLYMKRLGSVPMRRARGSSGQWGEDRLTLVEIDAYKRRTGQCRRTV